jgi:nucleotide-binding universal stress UspA family protein
MYKKILIPTDGSDLSNSAAHAGIEFARQINAEVVGIFVAPEYQYPIYVEVIPPSFPTDEEYRLSMLKAGEQNLGTVRDAANAAGIKFSAVIMFSDAIAHEVVKTAEEHGCDLIFMGSHGRSGWGQALLGSVTTKVLSTCQIPVLIHRVKHAHMQHINTKQPG